MKMIDKSGSEYIKELASSAPVPGGGGTSALVGAIGTALGCMVGNLTTGKKKYAEVEEKIQELLSESQGILDKLSMLVDEDAKVFAPLAKAYGMPKDTEEERSEKERVLEECLKNAAKVPFDIMCVCCEAIDIMKEFAVKGSRLAVSDAGVGASMLGSALRGASLNVYINTKAMKDREYAGKLNEKTEKMLTEYVPKADEIFEYVLGELK